MIEIEELVDGLVDMLDNKLAMQGIELVTDETDELRDCIQMILEAREGM